jgi:hypothetical protein
MSRFGFQSIEHALAAVAHDTVVGARAVATATAKLQKVEPTIEDITALIDPPAVVIERAAFAALGSLANAAHDTSTSASANGLNISMDAETLNDYKQLYKTLTDQLRTLNAGTPPSVIVDSVAAGKKAH